MANSFAPNLKFPNTRIYSHNRNVCLLHTTRGLFALVDAVDMPEVEKYRWRAAPAKHGVYVFGGPRGNLHQLLMKPPKGLEVDHKNRNPLDNRRCNLRVVTHVVNIRNQGLDPRNKTGVRGVTFEQQTQRYKASIKVDKVLTLGRFDTIEEAARARKSAEEKYWREPALVG